MTFRAKPAVKHRHRPNWEADARRSLYVTLGFGLLVLAALLILGGAAAASYYGEHLAAAATVNGVGISKDAVVGRIKIDTFRLDEAERRLQDYANQGRLDATTAENQRQQLEQTRTSIAGGVTDELIDDELKFQLAKSQGINVTDQQVTDRLTKESTTPGAIHAFVIAIKPSVSSGKAEPDDTQKKAAQVQADYVLGVLKRGGDFATIAKAQSNDTTASNGGDLGFLSVGDTSLDPAFEQALFALPENGMTGVVTGADGTLRIGKVTRILAQSVDSNYQTRITNAGISIDSYKQLLRENVAADALTDKVTSGLVDQATAQRHVLQIKLNLPQTQSTGDEVKVRHILFSPNHDPNAAQQLPQTDPAWAKAKADADAAFKELQADPTPDKFQAIAKEKSDDKGSGAQGGDLPYETQDALTKNFADAIFKPGLKAGQLIGPVQTEFGWHIIQFIDRRKPAAARIQDYSALLGTGTGQNAADFATLAKNGDGPEAANGGDIGWVAHNQLPKELEDTIFATPVGHVSKPVTGSDGYYIFKILAEETRKPDPGEQTTALKSNGFSNWYNDQKAKAKIDRDPNYTPPSA